MKDWHEICSNLKDESHDPHLTQNFCHQVFRELRKAKIKDKGKFKNRMGPEFEAWTKTLETKYPEDLVREIINDDKFWLHTLLKTQKIRV